MHFLAHYFTELPQENPFFIAGLLIPDLAPAFTRIYNRQAKHIPWYGQEDLQMLHRGVMMHYKSDKWFHASPVFNNHVRLAIAHFTHEKLNRDKLRLSVLAHLAVELLLDRHILLNHETVCTAYYGHLDQVREPAFINYFGLLSQELAGQKFFSKFQFFRQKKFLFLFCEIENIVEALDHIYSRVNRAGFTAIEKMKFLAALRNIDFNLRYSWHEMLKR